jgi:hypothetical protein
MADSEEQVSASSGKGESSGKGGHAEREDEFAFVLRFASGPCHATCAAATREVGGERSTEWCAGEWWRPAFEFGSEARPVSGEFSNDLIAGRVSARGGECCDSARERSGAREG